MRHLHGVRCGMLVQCLENWAMPWASWCVMHNNLLPFSFVLCKNFIRFFFHKKKKIHLCSSKCCCPTILILWLLLCIIKVKFENWKSENLIKIPMEILSSHLVTSARHRWRPRAYSFHLSAHETKTRFMFFFIMLRFRLCVINIIWFLTFFF